MRVYLCAGFGSPLSLEDWSLISDLGFDGIRTDVPHEGDAGALVANIVAAGRDGLMVAPVDVPLIDQTLSTCEAIAVAAKASGQPESITLEVGNEPDRSGRWRYDPQGFGRLVASVVELVRDYLPLKVVTGGIGSLSQDALAWLGHAVPYMPCEVIIGYHPYRSTPPGIPRKGFSSRQAEFAELHRIADGRSIWNTEIGWHTAPRPKEFPLCFARTSYSEGEVASFLRSEMRINQAGMAEVSCVYQLNCGPQWRTYGEDAFGIRRYDGTLRPAAYVAREWRA